MSARRLRPDPAPRALLALCRACVATLVLFGSLSLLALAGATLPGCGSTVSEQIRSNAVLTAQGVTRVVNVETGKLLRVYCIEQMRAAGHPAEYTDEGRCLRADRATVPNSSGTPEQGAAVADVVHRWQPVMDAHERLVHAHNTLVHLLTAADAVADGSVLVAVGEVAQAYADLRDAARTVNYVLPQLLGGE